MYCVFGGHTLLMGLSRCLHSTVMRCDSCTCATTSGMMRMACALLTICANEGCPLG